MTESGEETRILQLATTAVPSLGRCNLEGVNLFDTGWQATGGACVDADVRADVERQFPALGGAGGPVQIRNRQWGFVFPLRSIEGQFGYLVAGADHAPSPAAQFLVRVLAQQTGIALANARLHVRERRTAAEVQAVNVQLTATVAALRRSTDIHERLTRTAVAAEGREGIARAVYELTGYPVAIGDGLGRFQTWAGPERSETSRETTSGIREQMVRRALAAARPLRDGPWLFTVAQPRAGVAGVLALFDPDAQSGEQEQVALEHGATVLAIELARLEAITETEIRLRRNLVDELVAGSDEPGVLERAQALGYDLQQPHRVAVVTGGGSDLDPERFFDVVRRTARDTGVGTLLSPRGSAVVVVTDAAHRWDSFCAAVVAELRGGECLIGVGGACQHVVELPRSLHQAQLAVKMGRAAEHDEPVVVYDDLGVYRMFAEIDDPAGVERFSREWLGTLIDYDARRRSQLVLTLSTYLERGGNYDATAAALSMHRSTLKYRLQRIRDISGHDLSNADTRFNLQLAARAWHTLGVLNGDGT
jgi:sugar diacid utilization regulator